MRKTLKYSLLKDTKGDKKMEGHYFNIEYDEKTLQKCHFSLN